MALAERMLNFLYNNLTVQSMDYEELYRVLPKIHSTWTVNDTLQWLQFVGLRNMGKSFEQLAIDGSVLSQLTEQQIQDELGVHSRLVRKKIMAWVQRGFSQFDAYVSSMKVRGLQQSRPQPTKMEIELPVKSEQAFNQHVEMKEISDKVAKRKTEQQKRHQPIKMTIQQLDQLQAKFYIIDDNGATLGRQADNSIAVIDEYISRFHAQIIFHQNTFYIRDLGSQCGTFIRIDQKMQMEDGMIIELGSNQLQFRLEDRPTLTVVDGTDEGNSYILNPSIVSTVGRKDGSVICFPADQHLSLLHSKIYQLNGVWYIEDWATTNGTWMRLSEPSIQSEPYPLKHKGQFKLSSNTTFECSISGQNHRSTIRIRDICPVCNIRERNCFCTGCGQVLGCIECASSFPECPKCHASANKIQKLYRS